MSKDKTSSKPRKGMVIDRRRNRTLDTSIARSEPKWADVGHGVLQNTKGNQIHLRKGKWASVSKEPQPAEEQTLTLEAVAS